MMPFLCLQVQTNWMIFFDSSVPPGFSDLIYWNPQHFGVFFFFNLFFSSALLPRMVLTWTGDWCQFLFIFLYVETVSSPYVLMMWAKLFAFQWRQKNPVVVCTSLIHLVILDGWLEIVCFVLGGGYDQFSGMEAWHALVSVIFPNALSAKFNQYFSSEKWFLLSL